MREFELALAICARFELVYGGLLEAGIKELFNGHVHFIYFLAVAYRPLVHKLEIQGKAVRLQRLLAHRERRRGFQAQFAPSVAIRRRPPEIETAA